MLEDLDRELREALDREFESVRLASHLKKIGRSLKQEHARLGLLETTLVKEERDVERLEGLSLTGMFLAVLGGKEERLEKERQEFLAAKLSHDECEASIGALTEDAEALMVQLNALGNVTTDLRNLYQRKQRALEEQGGRAGTLLRKLAEETTEARGRGKEIREALAAGREAREELLGLREILQSARNWGSFDLLGGGLIATSVKHGRIDLARRKIRVVQQLLARFNRELEDIPGPGGMDLEIEIGQRLRIADYIFDGLIVDWMVQDRIVNGLERTDRVIRRVRSSIARLEVELRGIDEVLADAKTARRKLIERS